VTGRRGRIRKQLLGGFKGKRGYWRLEGEALDRALWEKLFCKGLWACRRRDCRMNELSVVPFLIFREFAVLLLLDVWVAPHDVMSTLFFGENWSLV
jgi:hypothetical protein